MRCQLFWYDHASFPCVYYYPNLHDNNLQRT